MVGTVLAFLGASLSVSAGPAVSTAAVAPSRVIGDWRQSPSVLVANSEPSAARLDTAVYDAAPDAKLERVLLLLSPSHQQEKALTTTLEKLQDPSSSLYHQWFSPAAYAAAFANSAADVAALSEWLKSRGLEVAAIPAGRGWLEFSGTVAQVEETFHTRIVAEMNSAGARFQLAGGLYVPAALAPLVAGIGSLDGVLAEPALTSVEPVVATSTKAEVGGALRDSHADQAKAVMQLAAAQMAGVTGAGQTVAIVGRSNVNPADVAAFRTAHGLAVSALQVVPAGADPGLNADQAEATLAASEIAAAAPDAQIVLVPAATTSATDGVDLSLAAIVDGKLAQTVVVGYSACEGDLSRGRRALYAALYRQAAAEGISVIAAAGDSGAAACRANGEAGLVSTGYGVNALASTPWNTAVGVAAIDSSRAAQKTSALSAWSVEAHRCCLRRRRRKQCIFCVACVAADSRGSAATACLGDGAQSAVARSCDAYGGRCGRAIGHDLLLQRHERRARMHLGSERWKCGRGFAVCGSRGADRPEIWNAGKSRATSLCVEQAGWDLYRRRSRKCATEVCCGKFRLRKRWPDRIHGGFRL